MPWARELANRRQGVLEQSTGKAAESFLFGLAKHEAERPHGTAMSVLRRSDWVEPPSIVGHHIPEARGAPVKRMPQPGEVPRTAKKRRLSARLTQDGEDEGA